MGSGTVTQGIAEEVRSKKDGERYKLKFYIRVEERTRLLVSTTFAENPEGRLTDGQRVRVSGKVTDDEITSPLVIYNQSTKSFVKPPPGIPLWAKIGLILPMLLLPAGLVLIFAARDKDYADWVYLFFLAVFVVTHAAIIYRLFATGLVEWFGRGVRRIPDEVAWGAACSVVFFLLALLLKVTGPLEYAPVLLLVASLFALGVYVVLFLVKSDRPRKDKRLWVIIAASWLVVVVGFLVYSLFKGPPLSANTAVAAEIYVPVDVPCPATVVNGIPYPIRADTQGKVTSLESSCTSNHRVGRGERLFTVNGKDETAKEEAEIEYNDAVGERDKAMVPVIGFLSDIGYSGSGIVRSRRGTVISMTPEQLYDFIKGPVVDVIAGLPRDKAEYLTKICRVFKAAYDKAEEKKIAWYAASEKGDKTYRSPVTGFVKEVYISGGQIITAYDVRDKKTLVRVTGDAKYTVVATVAQSYIYYIGLHHRARVKVNGSSFEGEVAATIPNNKVIILPDRGVPLTPGMTGWAKIDGKWKALAIPRKAVVLRKPGRGVFVPAEPGDGRVKVTFVRVKEGNINGDKVVIEQGLKKGDTVIVGPPEVLGKLEHGDEVQLK